MTALFAPFLWLPNTWANCEDQLTSVIVCDSCFLGLGRDDDLPEFLENLKELLGKDPTCCCMGRCGEPIVLGINETAVTEIDPDELQGLRSEKLKDFLLGKLKNDKED